MPVISIVYDGFTERTYVDGRRMSERVARFENGGWTFHHVCTPGAPTGVLVGFGGQGLVDESQALAPMSEKPRKQKARKVGAQKEHRRPRKRHRRRKKQ